MITPFVGHFVTVMVDNIQWLYNVIVVASNDNESSQVTLPGFSICVPVPVIRGPTRFLTMAKVAEVEDGVVIVEGFRELKNAL